MDDSGSVNARLDDAHAALFDLKSGIKIGAHTDRAAVRYSLCFSGQEAVSFLMQKKLASSRSEASALMQQLMNANCVSHMTNKKTFSDKEFAFFRCAKAPPLQGLIKEGLVSVAFCDTEYFSMFAQLDSQGLRFFRAREHAAYTYPLYFIAADSIVKVAQQADAKNMTSGSGRHEEVAESFRNSGDLSVGYQHVVWTFKPAMALWNASLKKRDAKNACFLLAGQNLTDFEFSIHESADSEVYIACSSEREKVDWLIALDFAALSVRKSAPAPCLVKYFDALGLPKSLFGDCKDYGNLDGIPMTSAVLEINLKCTMLRLVAQRTGQMISNGWNLREGLLMNKDKNLVFSWNGLVCSPISEQAQAIGYFVFDGFKVFHRRTRKELSALPTANEGDQVSSTDQSLLKLTTMIDSIKT